MRLCLLLIVLSLSFSVARAIEDTPANRQKQAERYLMVVPPKDLMAEMAEQIVKSAPPEQRETLHAVLTQQLDMDALIKAMMDAMVKHFTADEMSALADFYSSPHGKSAMKKMGVYMAELMPVMQKEIIRVVTKAAREMPSKKE